MCGGKGGNHSTDQVAVIPIYNNQRYIVFRLARGWYWESPDGLHMKEPSDSPEAAKAACEAHYRERLMEALGPVEMKFSSDADRALWQEWLNK